MSDGMYEDVKNAEDAADIKASAVRDAAKADIITRLWPPICGQTSQQPSPGLIRIRFRSLARLCSTYETTARSGLTLSCRPH